MFGTQGARIHGDRHPSDRNTPTQAYELRNLYTAWHQRRASREKNMLSCLGLRHLAPALFCVMCLVMFGASGRPRVLLPTKTLHQKRWGTPKLPTATAVCLCEAHRFCRWYSAPKCMYPCKPGEVERPIMMIIMAILNHGRLDHFRAKFRAAVYRNSVWDHAGQGTGVQSWVSHTFVCV
jgi:hypothetical protein